MTSSIAIFALGGLDIWAQVWLMKADRGYTHVVYIADCLESNYYYVFELVWKVCLECETRVLSAHEGVLHCWSHMRLLRLVVERDVDMVPFLRAACVLICVCLPIRLLLLPHHIITSTCVPLSARITIIIIR